MGAARSLAVLALVAACRDGASPEACTIRCSDDSTCPAGSICSLDGYCHSPGGVVDCGPDAAPPDAGPDAAEPPDAAPSPPDGMPPPDAKPPPDAPRPCTGGDLAMTYGGNGHCYLVFYAGRTWGSADSTCQAFETHLATVQDLGENSFLTGLAGGYSAWIGGTDQGSESIFRWVTVEGWGYTNWDADEPNDNGDEDCVELMPSAGGRWNDKDCGVGRAVLCERE